MTTTEQTLEQIRAKFPRALYPPLPTCSRCSGSGVDPVRTARAKALQYMKDGDYPCSCLFFGERYEEMDKMLTRAIRRASES